MISGRSVQPLGRFPAESDGESARADGGASDDGACGHVACHVASKTPNAPHIELPVGVAWPLRRASSLASAPALQISLDLFI